MLKRVYLEITNSCNLDCPFCSYEKGHRFLTLKEIEDTIVQIKPFCNYIYLHILGEPLLHPDFESILQLLDKYDFNLQLVSNGTLLTKYPDIFTHPCLRKLSISMHANADKDQEFFAMINKLIAIKNRKILELRFYDYQNLNLNLKNYLENLLERYEITLDNKTNSYKIDENTYIYFQDLFNWPSLDNSFISDTGTCRAARDMIAITSDLKVTICCLDPNAYNYIGDLRKESLKAILNSDKYKQYISDMQNHKLKSALCQRCSYRLRFK